MQKLEVLHGEHRPISKNKSDLVADNTSESSLAAPFNIKQAKMNQNISEGNTTAQTFDDSFTEVTQRKSRRENKQMSKEKM